MVGYYMKSPSAVPVANQVLANGMTTVWFNNGNNHRTVVVADQSIRQYVDQSGGGGTSKEILLNGT